MSQVQCCKRCHHSHRHYPKLTFRVDARVPISDVECHTIGADHDRACVDCRNLFLDRTAMRSRTKNALGGRRISSGYGRKVGHVKRRPTMDIDTVLSHDQPPSSLQHILSERLPICRIKRRVNYILELQCDRKRRSCGGVDSDVRYTLSIRGGVGDSADSDESRDSALSIPLQSFSLSQPLPRVTTLRQLGLPNVGNTCYANSILQMLYSCERIRNIICNQSQVTPLRSLFYHLLRLDVRTISKHQHIEYYLNHRHLWPFLDMNGVRLIYKYSFFTTAAVLHQLRISSMSIAA